MNWLEVSLTVDGEIAEAVADVLARFAPNGVTTEQAVRFNAEEDEGTPVGPITVRAYLPVDETLETRRLKLEEALYYLGMIQPLPAAIFKPIEDQNWMEAWKERYQPIPIGKRLVIVPAWLESPDPSRLAIKIDPGMAFGTGTHPTTQLCLEYIEECLDENGHDCEPTTVIDVGCGSGILSIGAIRMGTAFALGVDIDEAAIRASRENALTNGINDDSFQLGIGSVAEIIGGEFKISRASLVLANILAPVLVRLFEIGLATLVAPGGRIILSGILEEQTESVKQAAERHDLTFVEQKQMGDWVALMYARN
jgi:ribosomal protein L11 methyltransferase